MGTRLPYEVHVEVEVGGMGKAFVKWRPFSFEMEVGMCNRYNHDYAEGICLVCGKSLCYGCSGDFREIGGDRRMVCQTCRFTRQEAVEFTGCVSVPKFMTVPYNKFYFQYN